MKLKSHFTLIILLGLCTYSFSQDWSLLKPGLKYNFTLSNDSLIVATLWIDSIQTYGSDTIYYLNRIVKDCDTCNEWLDNNPKFAYYNQPQFLQKKVYVTDSLCYFISPEKYVLFSKESKGFSWTFDTANAINATIVDMKEVQLFDTADSIKYILLTSGDTIIISKNYGILRFDPVYENQGYILAGINKKAGKSVPDFFDVYNFSVGDIFEYKGYEILDGSPNKFDFIEKDFINSRTVIGDTLKYGVHIKYASTNEYGPNYLPPFYEYSYKKSYDAEWIFVNTFYHPANKFNGELIDYDEILNSYGYNPEAKVIYTLLKMYYDENQVLTKMIGSERNIDYFSVADSSHNLFQREPFIGSWDWDINEYRYQVGLGEVYFLNSGFEWGKMRELVAYKKGNDTVGTLANDDFFSDFEEYSVSDQVNLFPNPTNEFFTVTGINSNTVIEIFDINGKLVFVCNTCENPINISQLQKGVYMVKITKHKTVVVRKLLKE